MLHNSAVTCVTFATFYDKSITPFGAEQKANIIVTRVKIMITFCVVQNVIQIYKSGRANFATSTYDYSIECIFHKRKSQLSIDLVWPSTSNSALFNLLCFMVSDV